MMFSLLHTFCLHFYLINIHIFDYPDSRLSGQFTEVPTSPDNRGSTVAADGIVWAQNKCEIRKCLTYWEGDTKNMNKFKKCVFTPTCTFYVKK